jgi:hypothetical protein
MATSLHFPPQTSAVAEWVAMKEKTSFTQKMDGQQQNTQNVYKRMCTIP